MADRTVTTHLRMEVAGYIAGARKAAAEGKDLTRQITSDAAKMQGEWQTVGKGLGVVAGAIGLVGFAAAKTSADFNADMSSVQAATMATAAELRTLREAALQAGADTAFSASDAAAGIRELAKAGVQTTDILSGGLAGALDLAASGGLAVGDAAETAATAMAQFKLQGSEVPHIADLLAAAAGKAQGEVSDMAYALRQSGLVASQTGLSLEETVAALAAFAERGLLGQDAGTSFKTMLQRLANPTDKQAQLMRQLNIAMFDGQGEFVGLSRLAGQLRESLGRLTPAQRQAAMATIFGSDAVRAAAVLYEQGADGIEKWIGEVDQAGFASQQAGILLDNLKGDLEALSGSVETAFISAMEQGDGVLRRLVQTATGAVNLFNDAPPAVQQTATAVLGLTGVTAGAGAAALIAVPKIVEFRNALIALEAAGSPIPRMLRGVGGSIGALAGKAAAFAAVGVAVGTVSSQLDKLAHGGQGAEERLDSLAATLEIATRTGDLSGLQDVIKALDTIFDPSGPQQSTNRLSGLIDFTGQLVTLGTLDIRGTAHNLAEQVKVIDETLAAWVDSGEKDLAVRAWNEIAEAAAAQGINVNAAAKAFPKYTEALNLAHLREQDATGSANALAGAQSAVAEATDTATSALIRQAEEIAAQTDPILKAVRALEAAREAEAETRKAGKAGASAAERAELRRKELEATIAMRAALGELVDANGNVITSSEATAEALNRLQLRPEVKEQILTDLSTIEGALWNLAESDPEVTLNLNLDQAIERLDRFRQSLGLDPLTGTSADPYTPSPTVGMRRMHSGGWVDNGRWIPSLRNDERMFVGQTGELVLDREESRRYLSGSVGLLERPAAAAPAAAPLFGPDSVKIVAPADSRYASETYHGLRKLAYEFA